jgi:hypothetical protein
MFGCDQLILLLIDLEKPICAEKLIYVKGGARGSVQA